MIIFFFLHSFFFSSRRVKSPVQIVTLEGKKVNVSHAIFFVKDAQGQQEMNALLAKCFQD